MSKRARERLRQERQQAKRQRRVSRADGPAEVVPERDEAALMAEFHRLSESRAADLVTESQYLEERHKIFVALGVETDDDR